jgi:hypothetical protein
MTASAYAAAASCVATRRTGAWGMRGRGRRPPAAPPVAATRQGASSAARSDRLDAPPACGETDVAGEAVVVVAAGRAAGEEVRDAIG